MSAPSLPAFLLARYAELEEVARKVIEGTVNPEWLDTEEEPWWCDEQTEHVAMAPARVLADVEAKRRIVEDYAHLLEASRGPMSRAAMRAHAEFVVRVLATPYADHPDYQEAWKP